MARTPRDTLAATQLGARLHTLKARLKDQPGYERIARDIENVHDVSMSKEQVRRYHVGDVDPNVAPVEELQGLVSYYRVPPKRLGLIAARRIERAQALFGGPGTPGDQGITPTACNGEARVYQFPQKVAA